MGEGHKPVLVKEVLEYLNVKKGGIYVDATVGAGGHSRVICDLGGRILGIDRDPTALELAKQNLSACSDSVLVNVKFSQISEVVREYGFGVVDGVLFDLGISSMQLDNPGRGFSFQQDEPLDMRMNQGESIITAYELVNALREDQLYELFLKTNQANVARAAARAIVGAREIKKIETTGDLARIIEKSVGRKRHIHPATTIFMALRMVVNSETEELEKGLTEAVKILKPYGRLVAISFHSGEDRVVKNFFKHSAKSGELRIVTQKPILPGWDEIRRNPRSRSAKLRVAEKQ